MADIELNKLGIKSDSLPDNWLVTLVNPTTGAIAENMTVARFIELFIMKLPSYVKIDSRMDINDYKSNAAGYGYGSEGWLTTGPVFKFGSTDGYQKHIQGSHGDNNLMIRTINNGLPTSWKRFAFIEDIPSITAASANILTDTITEKVQVSTDTPMLLKNTGEQEQTIERYEYNISKMALAILELQKQVNDLKS